MPIINSRIRFECTRCGKCCKDLHGKNRQILLTKEDYDRIKIIKSLNFAEANNNKLYPFKMKKIKGKCIFLDKNNCLIYEQRPLICRFYPFMMYYENDTFIFGVDKKCEGVGKGEFLKNDYFENLMNEFYSRLPEKPKYMI